MELFDGVDGGSLGGDTLELVYCELVESVKSQADVNLEEIAVRGLKVRLLLESILLSLFVAK